MHTISLEGGRSLLRAANFVTDSGQVKGLFSPIEAWKAAWGLSIRKGASTTLGCFFFCFGPGRYYHPAPIDIIYLPVLLPGRDLV